MSLRLEDLSTFSLSLAFLKEKVKEYGKEVGTSGMCPFQELELALTSMTFILARAVEALKRREVIDLEEEEVSVKVEADVEDVDLEFPMIYPDEQENEDPLKNNPSFGPGSRRRMCPVVRLTRLEELEDLGRRDGDGREPDSVQESRPLVLEEEDEEDPDFIMDETSRSSGGPFGDEGDDEIEGEEEIEENEIEKDAGSSQEPEGGGGNASAETELKSNAAGNPDERGYIKCPIHGCYKKLKGRVNWVKHIRRGHRAEYDKDPGKYKVDEDGDSRPLMKCFAPDCDLRLKGRKNWIQHIRRIHRAIYDENREKIISAVRQRMEEQYAKPEDLIQCPVSPCQRRLLGRRNWLSHIRHLHRLEYEKNPNIIYADGTAPTAKNESGTITKKWAFIKKSEEGRFKCPVPECSWKGESLRRKRVIEHLYATHPDFLLEKQGIRASLHKIPNKSPPEELAEAKKRKEEDAERRKKNRRKSALCPVCGILLKYKKSLIPHLKAHKGEFPLSCYFCEKPYRDISGLREHLRNHTMEKPYKCEGCGEWFMWNYFLKKHIAKAHTSTSKGEELCKVEVLGGDEEAFYQELSS